MKIDQILNFKCVADERSYTRAAEKCFLTQPAIYNQVRQLESQCGAKLFYVSGKEVLLTAEGRELYTFAQAVAIEYESYRRHSHTSDRRRSRSVRVAALSHLSTITEASKQLITEDATFIVEFHSYHPTEAMELIGSGDLDFGFYGPAFWMTDLVFEQCGECVVAVIVPSGHLLAGREVEFDELATHSLVGYASGSARLAIDEWLDQHPGSEIHYVAQADSSGAAKTLALTVDKPAFVILQAVTDDLVAGTITKVHVRDFQPSFPLFAIYRKEKELGPGAKRFLTILRQLFDSAGPNTEIPE